MMEEKKLTDEEIVKALECLAGHKACDLCKYDDLAMQDGERTCVNIVAEEAIDLIHRLQTEIKRLKENNANQVRMRCDMQRKFDDLQNLCIEQKEEIERLKSFIDFRTANVMCDKCKEQTVKDTQKEILQGIYKWLNQAISFSYDVSVKGSLHYGGKNKAFHEVKELVEQVAKSKGVEVE